MRKRVFALLLCFTLPLSACGQGREEIPEPAPTVTATPAPTPTPTPEPEPTSEEVTELWGFPIDDTHDAFEVPTGGKLGTVLVTVELDIEHRKYCFAVWSTDDLNEPLQVMETESGGFRMDYVVDANFDGYMDFGYTKLATLHTLYFNFWLWDEQQGQFVIEPQLAEIPELQFDKNTKTIFGRYSSWNYGNDSIYQWQGTDLVCVRKITVSRLWDEEGGWLDQYEWTVQALVGNELAEIHRETATVSEDSFFTLDNIEGKWYDLDYHGE